MITSMHVFCLQEQNKRLRYRTALLDHKNVVLFISNQAFSAMGVIFSDA